MSVSVCVAASTLDLLHAGGHFWFYLNWALGLRAAGCRVSWLERVDAGEEGPEAERAGKIETLRSFLEPYGLRDSVALWSDDAVGDEWISERGCRRLDEIEDADLVLDFGAKLDAETLARFRRTALLDIDPGLTQLWAHEGGYSLPAHDHYFTIGETVGAPEARFPDLGLPWRYTPTAVFLPEWPFSPPPDRGAFTTVSSWWGWWERDGDETFDNSKRASFLELADLAAWVDVPLELALEMWGRSESEDFERLRSMGWSVRDARQVAGSPSAYRDYLRGSLGEFSCAKPSCMRLRNAWISDRSLCYMALGRPVVVQDTGPSRMLGEREGFLRFADLDAAARALDEARSNYERHARSARAIVEEHFDAVSVATRLLERCL